MKSRTMYLLEMSDETGSYYIIDDSYAVIDSHISGFLEACPNASLRLSKVRVEVLEELSVVENFQ